MKRSLFAVLILALASWASAAQVATKGALWTPAYEFWNGGGSPAFGNNTIDAAADRVAFVVRMPKAGTLGKVRIRLGTVSAIGGSSTLRVSFQNVDATNGNPDDTDDQFRDIASGSIVSNTSVLTDLITSDGTDTGTKRTVTKGEVVCVVVKYGTFTAGDNVIINAVNVATRGGRMAWDYATANTTGSYGKLATMLATVSVQYDDGTYAETIGGALPILVAGTVAYNNTSTPDEIGLRFQVAYPCKISAAVVGVDADGDFDLVLYDASSATNLGSYDKDVRSGTVAQTGPIPFTAEVSLSANTTYVLAVKPTSATNLTLHYVDVAEAAEFNQWGGGTEMYYVTAKDPTTTADFSATTTRRPMIGLVITSLDDGAAQGGTSAARVPNGM